MPSDLTNLRRLLENEPYPHRYMHKVIGRTTDAFEQGVAELEARFPRAVRLARRESRPPGAAVALYVSYTFEIEARTADEIIELVAFTETIRDAVMML